MKSGETRSRNPFARWFSRRTAGDTLSLGTAATDPSQPRPSQHATVASEPQSRQNPRDAVSDTVWVTTLVENTVNGRDLQAEHGLAFCIRTRRHCLLFDTGQSDLLLKNARTLSVGLENVEAIALSHGHYDHTGGLQATCAAARKARIHLHPEALAPKFAGNPDGTSRSVGISEANAQAVRAAADSVVWTTRPTEVVDGIFVTGEIPRQNAFEDGGGRFFLDEDCTQPDPLVDDQALFFDTRDGLVVLLGCAHAGVVNTLEYIQRITSGRPFQAVFGGLHLLSASPERRQKTIEAFRRWDIQTMAPAHCTGMSAIARLWTEFPDRCSSCAVGVSMAFHK